MSVANSHREQLQHYSDYCDGLLICNRTVRDSMLVVHIQQWQRRGTVPFQYRRRREFSRWCLWRARAPTVMETCQWRRSSDVAASVGCCRTTDAKHTTYTQHLLSHHHTHYSTTINTTITSVLTAVFTARRYASATYAVVVCPSVRLSVTTWSSIKMA